MNPTYEHHRPYDGCDLYRGDALDVLPLLAEEGITFDSSVCPLPRAVRKNCTMRPFGDQVGASSCQLSVR